MNPCAAVPWQRGAAAGIARGASASVLGSTSSTCSQSPSKWTITYVPDADTCVQSSVQPLETPQLEKSYTGPNRRFGYGANGAWGSMSTTNTLVPFEIARKRPSRDGPISMSPVAAKGNVQLRVVAHVRMSYHWSRVPLALTRSYAWARLGCQRP